MVETCVIENEIIVDSEPEFAKCKNIEAKIQYFVVCKKNQNMVGSVDAFDLTIAGEKLCDWVARVCSGAEILKIYDYQNEIDVVKQNIKNSDYVVVLNGNIPLLTKQKLKDILGFVIRKNMNVCKLKAGIILKTEYLNDLDEIYSADVYNLKTNDFFEVDSLESLEFAKEQIKNRIFGFYSKNGVNFESANINVDANVKLGYGATIYDNAQILKDTKIKDNVIVGKNAIIESSSIGDNCLIGDNVVIKNCNIGANVKIFDDVYLSDCEILNNCEIHTGTKIIDSRISDSVVVQKLCSLVGCEICENAIIGNMARLYRAEIEKDYNVFDGKVIIHREEK